MDRKIGQAVFEATYCCPSPTVVDLSRGEAHVGAYRFEYSRDRQGHPDEGGCVRFGWSEQGLYAVAEFEDSHLVALNRKDEQLHYKHGDVFELFVKPCDEDYYWEMYAIPSGNKATLFFPRDRDGMTVEQHLRDHSFHGLEVTVEETSKGWNACMFVPASQLTALGAGWGDDTPWTIFCGRYNYKDDDLKNLELSMAPPLSATNYHLTQEYAELRLLGACLNN
jgi:hypothetical protein